MPSVPGSTANLGVNVQKMSQSRTCVIYNDRGRFHTSPMRHRLESPSWLAGEPPAKERSKGRIEEPEIETENEHATCNGRPGGDRFVHQGTHQIAATRKHDQGDHR